MDEKRSLYRTLQSFAVGSTMAFQFAVSVVLGILGGRYLDELWGTGPWLLLLGLLMGLGAGTLAIVRAVTRLWPRDRSDNNDRS